MQNLNILNDAKPQYSEELFVAEPQNIEPVTYCRMVRDDGIHQCLAHHV